MFGNCDKSISRSFAYAENVAEEQHHNYPVVNRDRNIIAGRGGRV